MKSMCPSGGFVSRFNLNEFTHPLFEIRTADFPLTFEPPSSGHDSSWCDRGLGLRNDYASEERPFTIRRALLTGLTALLGNRPALVSARPCGEAARRSDPRTHHTVFLANPSGEVVTWRLHDPDYPGVPADERYTPFQFLNSSNTQPRGSIGLRAPFPTNDATWSEYKRYLRKEFKPYIRRIKTSHKIYNFWAPSFHCFEYDLGRQHDPEWTSQRILTATAETWASASRFLCLRPTQAPSLPILAGTWQDRRLAPAFGDWLEERGHDEASRWARDGRVLEALLSLLSYNPSGSTSGSSGSRSLSDSIP
jgi:hypothetical protein